MGELVLKYGMLLEARGEIVPWAFHWGLHLRILADE